jgi:hypothetical protein
MGGYTVYILIQNFELRSKKLVFDKFSITRVDNSNWRELKDIFRFIPAKRLGQYFIERRNDKLPKLPKGSTDVSGLGRIPYDSEYLSNDLVERLNDGDLRSSFAQALTYIEEYFSESDEYKEYEYEDEDGDEGENEDDG